MPDTDPSPLALTVHIEVHIVVLGCFFAAQDVGGPL